MGTALLNNMLRGNSRVMKIAACEWQAPEPGDSRSCHFHECQPLALSTVGRNLIQQRLSIPLESF